MYITKGNVTVITVPFITLYIIGNTRLQRKKNNYYSDYRAKMVMRIMKLKLLKIVENDYFP